MLNVVAPNKNKDKSKESNQLPIVKKEKAWPVIKTNLN
jgi:hypothetical protein